MRRTNMSKSEFNYIVMSKEMQQIELLAMLWKGSNEKEKEIIERELSGLMEMNKLFSREMIYMKNGFNGIELIAGSTAFKKYGDFITFRKLKSETFEEIRDNLDAKPMIDSYGIIKAEISVGARIITDAEFSTNEILKAWL
jgi:hypothetical protein